MSEKMSLKDWINNFKNGEFEDKDCLVQIKAGWFDWFCKDTSLAAKTKRMGNIISQIKNTEILENSYVFFKNSCPISHPLYDSFSISDLRTGDSRYYVDVNCGYYDERYVVFTEADNFAKPLLKTNKAKEIKEFFASL